MKGHVNHYKLTHMPQTSNKFAKYVTLLQTMVRSRKLQILNTRHSSTQKPKQSYLFLEGKTHQRLLENLKCSTILSM
jgi:hypothetical protein